MSKEFKKYATSYGVGWITLTVLMSIMIVVFFISWAMGNDVKFGGLVVFIVLLLCSLIPLLVSSRFFKKLETDASVEQIEADFQKAVPMRKDTIRFGEKWIYLKRKSKLLSYGDITRVYQYIHRTNGFEDERALKYVNTAGKHRRLCKLELRNKSEQELVQIITLILSKNPDVKVGYQK